MSTVEVAFKRRGEETERFLKWAINAILQWENEEVPSNLLQIHGTKDWILPCSKSNNIIEVQNGGHLMVWTHPKQMDEALKSLI